MAAHPVPRLSRGTNGFTLDRVKQCLDSISSQDPGLVYRSVKPLDYNNYDWNFSGQLPMDARQGRGLAAKRLRDFCLELAEKMSRTNPRLAVVDEHLASWLQCSIPTLAETGEAVQQTVRLLERLPACSVYPPDVILARFSGVSVRKINKDNAAAIWEGTELARYLDTNTMRIAAILATQPWNMHDERNEFTGQHYHYVRHLNNTKAIMEEALSLWDADRRGKLSGCYLELLAFTWSAWQRSLALVLSDMVHERLIDGGFGHLQQIDVPNMARTKARLSDRIVVPPYICPWAFGILRTNAFACGGDWRTASARCAEYCQDFGLLTPRCIDSGTDTAKQCSGETIDDCKRFTGLQVEDQSAHSERCGDPERCAQNRLFWNPGSYRSVSGGRAVSIGSVPSDGLLRYRSASERTLTVSHVWSHGQGGRPEKTYSGLNPCLHERYCRLALQHGCDSYWIDTACIPEDHALRKEAIATINETFWTGKITVVCDKDIISADASNLTIELQERILAMILVCDWNQRAWTFLEAIKGRNHIHVLCKDEQTVSLKALLEKVFYEGSLDLISLFVDARHLVPGQPESEWPRNELSKVHMDELAGLVPTEEAACLLSRRHASRAGDEVVIWSLLSGGDPHQSAEAYWTQRLALDPEAEGPPRSARYFLTARQFYHGNIESAFLMSSVPRLDVDGLRWAPTRPAPEAQLQLDGRKRAFYPVRGHDSRSAFWQRGGLEGDWHIASFATTRHQDQEDPWWEFPFDWSFKQISWMSTRRRIEAKYLRPYKYGALLLPLRERPWDESYNLLSDEAEWLTAVVGSNTDLDTWTWIAVIAWPPGVMIADVRLRRITLV